MEVAADRELARAAARSTRYVLVRVTAPDAPHRARRLPVNLALVLDRSGSMESERKFGLAREAVERALAMLDGEDRFSLVVYDTEIDVLARSQPATSDARRRALEALGHVGPRGGTNLSEGWFRGCEQVGQFAADGVVSRCLLLTDGLANAGITDRDELARHAAAIRQRGTATTTFGVGADFDERLLADMAHEGGGNAYFIEGAAQIPDLLASEIGEALEVTLRDAVVEITLPDGAEAEPLNRFRWMRRDRGTVAVELGDMVARQELTLVLRVELPVGAEGSTTHVGITLRGAGAAEPLAEHGVTFTYASHAANDAQLRDRDVDREVAELYAARARAEATESNRGGRYDDAQRVLERTARRIRTYAGRDARLLALADALESEFRVYSAPMSAMELKASYYVAEGVSKSRPMGRARRR